MTPTYFTICSRNYLAYALTLRASLLAASPGAAFTIFLADEPVEGDAPCDNIIPVAEIGLPDLRDMAFRYTVMEFNTAIKPFCFEYLFDRCGAEVAIYLDPDILVFKPLDHITSALESGAEAVLTPHVTAPPEDDGKRPDALDLLRSGTYNLGFAAFANKPEARAFIRWWTKRCETDCVCDLSRGLFVDQKFAEFVPSFVGRTEILRHPGYNMAYWNLTQRPIDRSTDGTWTAAGESMRFFHFSGVVPGDASIFSKHQNRFTPEMIGPARDLLHDYHARLEANGCRQWAQAPYGFAHFNDGTLIPPGARRVYARSKDVGEFVVPFEPAYDRLNAKSPDVDQDARAPITVFMEEIWRGRTDLQRVYPLSSALGRRGFHRWFVVNGERECGVTPPLLAPARDGGVGAGLSATRKVFGFLPKPVRNFLRRRFLSNPSTPRR